MARKTTLLLGLVFASIAFAAVVGAATTVTGTVTVENGTADGANVTITPLTENGQMMDDPVRTTVEGNRFSAKIRDAPMYRVEVSYGGGFHYAILQNETTVSMTLNRTLSGRVVNASGEPQTDATIDLGGPVGYSVDRTKVDSNGNFSFAPVQPNRTYKIRVVVDGVPYIRTVETDENASVTVETQPPVDDQSVLEVTNGTAQTPAGHIVQVLPPQNDSQPPRLAEVLSLRNTADRPYAGTVTLVAPEGATPIGATFQGRRTEYSETPRGVAINVTIPANTTATVGAGYNLQDSTVRKRFGRDTKSVAVTFQGYEPQNVNYSANLAPGDAPIPMLTNTEPIAENDTIRLDLPSSTGSTSDGASSQQASAESNSMPAFPAVPLFGGLAAIVVVGLVAYRVL